MKFAILPILLISSLTTYSQITINSSDLPQPGQEYYRSTTPISNIDLSQTGANYTWDYADLEGLQRDTMIYFQVSQTPFFYQLLFNNPLTPAYQSTEAQHSPDVSIGGMLELTNNFLFSKNSNSEWNEVGIGTTITGAPLPTKYTDIKTKLKLPLHYNDSNSDDYSYLINIPGVGASGQDGTLSYDVDGYGTLITPGGTFDVLRVRTELNKSDTLYISLVGFGFRFPSNEVVYEWYAKTSGYPILTVKTQLGIITSVEFLDGPPVGLVKLEDKSDISIYPNPVNDVLQIHTQSTLIYATIIDLSGKVIVPKTKVNTHKISVNQLPKGVYFIQIETPNSTRIQKFIKL